jgi:ParB family chromosome partitioning protein
MALKNLKNLNKLAQTAKGKHDGKVILTVSTDMVISKAQVRKRFRDIEGLAATLLTEGQQSPVIVSPKNKQGKYVIQKGERRWRACKHATMSVDIVINAKEQTDLDETAGELIENIQRDDLTSIEIAKALQHFIDDGWLQKDIAKRIGKSISFVSSHLALLKLPECVFALYEKEITADTETLNNLRLLFDVNEARCRAVCEAGLTDGFTRKQSRDVLNDAKRVIKEGADKQPSAKSANTLVDESDTVVSQAAKEPVKDKVAGEQQWKDVKPGAVVICVKVEIEQQNKHGILMTDRIGLLPDTAWVKVSDEKGALVELSVPVNTVKIVSVSV